MGETARRLSAPARAVSYLFEEGWVLQQDTSTMGIECNGSLPTLRRDSGADIDLTTVSLKLIVRCNVSPGLGFRQRGEPVQPPPVVFRYQRRSWAT